MEGNKDDKKPATRSCDRFSVFSYSTRFEGIRFSSVKEKLHQI